MMKRGAILAIILLMSIFYNLDIISALNNTITGKIITGDATAGISVTVTVLDKPSIRIEKPLNKSYTSNMSLKLDIDSNSNDLWYNIDNGANITMNGDYAYFNTSIGAHKIYAFANNSVGVNGTNINFSVISDGTNINVFAIDYWSFSGENSGNSTNFNEYSNDYFQNATRIIFEHIQAGKIEFSEGIINLTNTLYFHNNITNFSRDINISRSRIEFNASALPNFNINATLLLYNLGFSNPRILKDNIPCSSSICKQNYYTNGNLSFNVTGFSIYSAEETPSDSNPGGSSGSSSGGGSSITLDLTKGFKIFQDFLRVSLKQGEAKKVQFNIENENDERIDFNINSTLGEFIVIRENKFSLGAREKKTITLEFLSFTNTKPDLYLGKIFVSAGKIKKEILVSIEIESVKALFDVKVEIPDRFSSLVAGEKILAQIEIFNVVRSGLTDVMVYYEIKDVSGNTIAFEQETIAVETQTEYIKEFLLPKEIKNGDYIFYIKTTAEGESASGIARFSVVDKKGPINIPLVYLALIGITFVLLLYIIYILRAVHGIKRLKIKQRISEKDLMKYKLIKRREEKNSQKS